MKKALTILPLLSFAFCTFAWAQGEVNGTIKATTKLRPDGTQAITIVDPDQRTAEETIKDSGGHVIRKTTYLLDERNFAIGAVHYDGKGNIRYRESYQRDSSDNVTESAFSTGDGKPLGKRVFVYRAGKAVSFEDYDAQGNRLASAQPVGPGRPDKHRR